MDKFVCSNSTRLSRIPVRSCCYFLNRFFSLCTASNIRSSYFTFFIARLAYSLRSASSLRWDFWFAPDPSYVQMYFWNRKGKCWYESLRPNARWSSDGKCRMKKKQARRPVAIAWLNPDSKSLCSSSCRISDKVPLKRLKKVSFCRESIK